jgi:MarR family transcriptional regulator, temperature-dependent positive regulator of motility
MKISNPRVLHANGVRLPFQITAFQYFLGVRSSAALASMNKLILIVIMHVNSIITIFRLAMCSPIVIMQHGRYCVGAAAHAGDNMSSRAHQTEPRKASEAVEPSEIYAMPGHLIRRMHQASQAIFDAQVSEAGLDLTSVQFAALAMIGATPGIDQATLANAIAFDRPTTGGVIDRLEAKGFVRREITKADRRMRHLYLEPAGDAILAVAAPIARRVQDLMLAGLSGPERATLLRLLSKALSAVGGSNRPALRSASTIRDSAR